MVCDIFLANSVEKIFQTAEIWSNKIGKAFSEHKAEIIFNFVAEISFHFPKIK